MPRGTKLSEQEIGQIQAFKAINLSNREISRRLGRSHKVINNFLANDEQYGKQKRSGRRNKLNQRTKRRIQKAVAHQTKGTRKVLAELQLNVSHQTVWRAIKESPNLVRQRMQKCPALKQQHKDARLAFAEQHCWWTNKWKNVRLGIFENVPLLLV